MTPWRTKTEKWCMECIFLLSEGKEAHRCCPRRRLVLDLDCWEKPGPRLPAQLWSFLLPPNGRSNIVLKEIYSASMYPYQVINILSGRKSQKTGNTLTISCALILSMVWSWATFFRLNSSYIISCSWSHCSNTFLLWSSTLTHTTTFFSFNVFKTDKCVVQKGSVVVCDCVTSVETQQRWVSCSSSPAPSARICSADCCSPVSHFPLKVYKSRNVQIRVFITVICCLLLKLRCQLIVNS